VIDESIFAPGFKAQPFWWDAAPRPVLPERPLPARVDVAVVGSGYTGLVAALTLARAGRRVAVFDAGDAGQGASSRNAGYVGRSLKHSFGELLERHGLDRAVAVYRDMRAAFDWVFALAEQEQIACKLVRCGRFIGARSPRQYETMAREYELRRRHLAEPFELVPRTGQVRELGSDYYCGGAVIPDHGALHPGLYHLGLLDRAQSAGVEVHAHTAVTGIRRDGPDFAVRCGRGTVAARDVLVATNGYVDAALPWFRRRLVPFHGYMVATEPLAPERIGRILPNARTVIEFVHNIFFLRRSPDGERLLFGGYTGGPAPNLKDKAARLHAALLRILPDLAGVRLSHAWTGKCAATFDLYPHIGVRDGVHYALGYCFAGLPMGSWMGLKAARRIMGAADSGTAFDSLPFRSLPLYTGNPWFVPLVMRYYDWQDRRDLR
jgi:glycine/D-amino acid oxidase-like deaminating enzyme